MSEAGAAGELGKLRWRCRRGMRELDVLLTRYLDDAYRSEPPEGQAAFRRLLEAPDPVIYGYFLGRDQPPDPVLRALVERIAAGGRIDR
jgi:antitoxin CptB